MRVDHDIAGVVDGIIAGHVIQHGMQQVGRCRGKNGDPVVNGLTCTDDDELMLNVLRCHLTY